MILCDKKKLETYEGGHHRLGNKVFYGYSFQNAEFRGERYTWLYVDLMICCWQGEREFVGVTLKGVKTKTNTARSVGQPKGEGFYTEYSNGKGERYPWVNPVEELPLSEVPEEVMEYLADLAELISNSSSSTRYERGLNEQPEDILSMIKRYLPI